jgi:deoxyadenosine/deoxycytidine kinase/NTP pyrophosphatase (non-canonical NTP hydrolase)
MTYYIAIEGVIGVGKTTLARYLSDELQATLLLEVFEENPFLAKFYEDRARYAFQTQIFFLLSRYHQQLQIHDLPRPLVSDYIFAKDRLFAEQNLVSDELNTYEQVYEALAANIPAPDLIIYLRADTSALMSRIAARDRSYERNMDAGYIERLRLAYEQFFLDYKASPVLSIDTNDIDFVNSETDRQNVISQIRGELGIGPHQEALPGLGDDVKAPVARTTSVSEEAALELEDTARRLGDFQRFHNEFDRMKGFNTNLLFNFLLLQEEIGELATVITRNWKQSEANRLPENTDELGDELADILAYVLKIANYTGVDLEEAYLKKMDHNKNRQWGDIKPTLSS